MQRWSFQILLIHLLGRPSSGDLARPFVAPAGFTGMGAPAAAVEEPVAAATITEIPEVESKKEKKSK